MVQWCWKTGVWLPGRTRCHGLCAGEGGRGANLCSTADTSAETAERHCALVVDDVLQVLLSLDEVTALKCHGCLATVLKVNTQVGTTSLHTHVSDVSQAALPSLPSGRRSRELRSDTSML